jgi:hypothetical protein
MAAGVPTLVIRASAQKTAPNLILRLRRHPLYLVNRIGDIFGFVQVDS